MTDQKAYECEHCKSQQKVAADAGVPECCGEAMRSIPLDQCTLSTSAEHARFGQTDEPCDDGRAG